MSWGFEAENVGCADHCGRVPVGWRGKADPDPAGNAAYVRVVADRTAGSFAGLDSGTGGDYFVQLARNGSWVAKDLAGLVPGRRCILEFRAASRRGYGLSEYLKDYRGPVEEDLEVLG